MKKGFISHDKYLFLTQSFLENLFNSVMNINHVDCTFYSKGIGGHPELSTWWKFTLILRFCTIFDATKEGMCCIVTQ